MDILYCFFDGACGPQNPGGDMGYGCYIKNSEKVIYEKYGHVPSRPDNTNNVAEYMALILILKYLEDNNIKSSPVIIKGDSNLVIMQIQGKWKIKRGAYKNHALNAFAMARGFVNLSFEWIPRESNMVADELSKKGLMDKSAVLENNLQNNLLF